MAPLLGFDNADQRFYCVSTLCNGVGGHNYVRDSCFGLATPAGESIKPVEYHYVFSLFLSSPVFDNVDAVTISASPALFVITTWGR